MDFRVAEESLRFLKLMGMLHSRAGGGNHGASKHYIEFLRAFLWNTRFVAQMEELFFDIYDVERSRETTGDGHDVQGTKQPMADADNIEDTEEPKADAFLSPKNEEFYRRMLYSELNAKTSEVRLLKYLPTMENEPPRYELIENISLLTPTTSYATVSYCAGNPQETREIVVNNVVFNAFRTLGDALDDIHQFWEKTFPGQELLLWADQICINQSNPNERSHQVAMMRKIYENGTQVFIHLAPPKFFGGHGVSWIHGLYQKLYKTMKIKDIRKMLVNEIKSDAQKFMDGLEGFFGLVWSRWWSRAWTFQEFIVSPKATFLSSRSSISWERMQVVLPALLEAFSSSDSHHSSSIFDLCWHEIPSKYAKRYLELQSLHSYSATRLELVQYALRSKKAWTSPRNLLTLLERSRACQATDPRDKVYAYLGLAHDDYEIVPDYSRENCVLDVFTQTAKRIIERDGVEILSYAVQYRAGKRPYLLPSWVPDWTSIDLVMDHEDSKNPLRSFGEPCTYNPWRPSDQKYSEISFHKSGESWYTMETMRVYAVRICMLKYEAFGTAEKWQTFGTGPVEDAADYIICTGSKAEIGDELWLIANAETPFLLRRTGDEATYLLIYHAYWKPDITKKEKIWMSSVHNEIRSGSFKPEWIYIC